MKRILVIIGAALVVALGLFMPRLMAAYQDKSISGDVRQMENTAVSLSLTQKLVALPELDLFQSLELFSSYVTMVELEEGRYTSAEEALQIASELVESVNMSYDASANSGLLPEEAVPCLLTDEDGNSGIVWRCGWSSRPNEAVWIDDQNGNLMGFCMTPNIPNLQAVCQVISEHFFPSYVSREVMQVEAGEVCIRLTAGEEAFNLAAVYPMEKEISGYLPSSYLYVYFNIPFDASAETTETGDSSGELGDSGTIEGDLSRWTGDSDSEISEIENIDE